MAKNIHFKSEAYHQSPSDKHQKHLPLTVASYLEQRNIPVGSQKTHTKNSPFFVPSAIFFSVSLLRSFAGGGGRDKNLAVCKNREFPVDVKHNS